MALSSDIKTDQGVVGYGFTSGGVQVPLLVDSSGRLVVSFAASAQSIAGPLTITSNAASSSTTTGALIVGGGIGVGGAAYFGGSIYGTLGTAAQTAITSVGTLSALTVSGLTRTQSGTETDLGYEHIFNAYYSGGYKYRATGVAGDFYLASSGIWYLRTAASGTAGDAVTFANVLKIDANGQVHMKTGMTIAYDL